MVKIQIEELIGLLRDGKVIWTEHCSFRMYQRGIHKIEIESAIVNGMVVEQYPEDYPYPSCLIAGHDTKGKTIHIVCGLGDENLYIITVYYPNILKWKNGITRRDD